MKTTKPIHASDFEDLADRRAWLASLPEQPPQVLAWPTMERLQRQDLPAARTLARYARLMDPQKFIACNDNDHESAAPAIDPEFRHEIRPTLNEMFQAALDGLRCRVISEKRDDGWQVVERLEAKLGFQSSDFYLGNLTFRAGKLVGWGTTKRGNSLKPREDRRRPRGAHGRLLARAAARFLLPTNDNTPIARGALFIGGKVGANGTACRPMHTNHDAEIIRRAESAAVRLKLGANAAVLDMAITNNATARDIGEAAGFQGKNAERRGKRLISEALQKFEEIAA